MQGTQRTGVFHVGNTVSNADVEVDILVDGVIDATLSASASATAQPLSTNGNTVVFSYSTANLSAGQQVTEVVRSAGGLFVPQVEQYVLGPSLAEIQQAAATMQLAANLSAAGSSSSGGGCGCH